MKEDNDRALGELLDQYDNKAKERADQQRESGVKEKEFSASVAKLFKEVIRPAMEEVRAKLQERGHQCAIFEKEETLTNELRQQPAQITMTIRPAAKAEGSTVTNMHAVSFWVIRHKSQVAIMSSSSFGRQAEPKQRAAYEAHELTRAVVKKELVGFLTGVLR